MNELADLDLPHPFLLSPIAISVVFKNTKFIDSPFTKNWGILKIHRFVLRRRIYRVVLDLLVNTVLSVF